MSANNPPNTNPPCRCADRAKAVMRTVSKEGPNKGRQFYTCAKSACKYFEWVNTVVSSSSNSPMKSTTGTSSGSTTQPSQFSVSTSKNIASSSFNGNTSSSANNSNLDMPCCTKHPNINCKLLQVSKEGPNRGKLFWACGCSNQSEKCNFFKWFDGEVDKYKHLVPNYNVAAQPSPKKGASALQASLLKEETVPIFMSTSNSQNNWVAGLPIETFSEILKYLDIAPDIILIQRVCVEWKRMSDIIIGKMVQTNEVELNLGFLRKDTTFPAMCEIFKKFYRVKQVTFCNFTIYSELMRVLEWVGVETLVFNNCQTIMSCDQNEAVKEHIPSYHDYEDEVDWEYVRSNQGSLFSKSDIAEYKTKFAFRRNVTQMFFSGLEEDKEVLVANANPKFIDDLLQFATLDCYKKFVASIKQKLGTNYVHGKRFENLKRIISIDSLELNFSWVNKDRNVYYKVINSKCEPGLDKFMKVTQEKAIVTEDDNNSNPTTINPTQQYFDWPYKNFMVQDRSIAIIVLPFTMHCGKVQVYNSISCQSKTVVEGTSYLSPNAISNVLKTLGIARYVKKEVFRPKILSLVQCGLVLNALNLKDLYPRKTILEIYLESALASSRKMVSCDLDELRKFCYHDPIQKAIKLLFFLHNETQLMENYEITPKVMHIIRSIDALWFHDEEFIDDDDEEIPSVASITTLINVNMQPVRVPFSWHHLVKTGKIKHIYELTSEESNRSGQIEDIESDGEVSDQGDSDQSSDDANEPEEDSDYKDERNESEEEEEEEEESESDGDWGKKRKRKPRATRSKKKKS